MLFPNRSDKQQLTTSTNVCIDSLDERTDIRCYIIPDRQAERK